MGRPKKDQAKEFVKSRALQWLFNPLSWVRDVFGDEIVKAQRSRGIIPKTDSGLSCQQEDALKRWGELIEAKYRAGKGMPLTKRQTELSKKIGMSIQSSNGNGKDFLAALVNWHFMACTVYPKIMVTANTGKQLKSVYWSEFAKIRMLARKNGEGPEATNLLQEMFEVQSEVAFAKLPNKDERGKRWFTECVTINAKATPDEQAEALAGRHEDYMAIIVDEASGIADSVFKPLERTLTGLVNLCFMIFNPTKNTGYAIETHTKYRDKWECLHWTALDCENVSPQQIEALRMYGEDSPAYRIGVLGLPPLSDSDALIPFEWIQDAINRELAVGEYDPVLAGLDVAAGGDRSALCIRQAGKVWPIKTLTTPDTSKTIEWAQLELLREDVAMTAVDTVGLGKTIYDQMRKQVPVKAVHGSASPSSDRFYNLRAEMYWTLRDQFENRCISIPDDPELVNELGAIKADYEGQKIKIVGKKEIRKQLGFSPDKADALAMSFLIKDGAYRKGKRRDAGRIDHDKVFYR